MARNPALGHRSGLWLRGLQPGPRDAAPLRAGGGPGGFGAGIDPGERRLDICIFIDICVHTNIYIYIYVHIGCETYFGGGCSSLRLGFGCRDILLVFLSFLFHRRSLEYVTLRDPSTQENQLQVYSPWGCGWFSLPSWGC